MTTAALEDQPARSTRSTRRAPLALLEGSSAFGNIGPNWFASVMGTGIVAIALVVLPVSLPGQRGLALGFWALDVLLLLAVTAATAAHHRLHPDKARSHLGHPVMGHFYGAPAMALMTVGTATLLVGVDVVGLAAAVAVDLVLWTAGTLFGVVTAVLVPLRLLAARETAPDAAFGGWLMPVVPPMVSAATGALLVPHLPAGQAQETMVLACYAFFGLSLAASLLVITSIWHRLVRHGVGPAAMVPTLWIVLGPLGQSITAVHNLALVAPGTVPAADADALVGLTLAYGVPVWGFAMLWLALAVTITVRTAREHLPFTLTWWSFTFPVGTVVTGTSGLAAATGLVVFEVAAVALMVLLLGAWCVVAARTVAGVWSGHLLRA